MVLMVQLKGIVLLETAGYTHQKLKGPEYLLCGLLQSWFGLVFLYVVIVALDRSGRWIVFWRPLGIANRSLTTNFPTAGSNSTDGILVTLSNYD